MNYDIALESPETDNEIKLAESDNRDNDVSMAEPSVESTTSWTGWYKHPRGGVYKICKDSDGYLVTKPNNSKDAWAAGYTWREVKDGYGLGGVSWYQERRSNARCK